MLGKGGMGKVYLAEDLELGRRIALKLLPEEYTADPKLRARLKHEAQAAAAINHPHVVTIYDFGQHEGNFYIAMEYVDGQSLKDLMEEDLELAKVIDIAIQIGEGLNEAHQAGVVHRDLKPANILINKKDQVKIADFGVARLKDATKLTAEGHWLGTIAYTSPEQVKGHDVDQRADIFSFGIVLYELITRQLPFKGETQAAVINAILNKEPEPLARYKNGISPGLQSIIDKALNKDPATRYQHIADLLADLKREKKQALETITLPIYKSGVTGIVKRTQSFIKVHRRSLRIVGIVALLLTILSVFADLIQVWEFVCSAPKQVSTTTPDQQAAPAQPAIAEKLPANKETGSPKRSQIVREYVLIQRSESEGGDFYIGKYEVSNQEYMEFWVEMKHRRPSFADNPNFNQPTQPVVGVSWYDAVAYCAWLSKKTGIGHALPTEEDWKLAAYGAEQRQFPWGEGSASKMRANFDNNAVGPVAVDSYPTGATLEGVFNLGGNVWEWCDAWSDYTQADRVILGGAWNAGPDDMRLAFRNWERPEENQRNDLGFRMVRAIQ